ncbi:hypothetical protein B9Z55_011463 [Caenorhabditis nigoni]|uniref:Uncharacterized protein n=1 Tax=Caenorhabditis nigoni TaxID=1611254 RepID=A0A2G5UK99_9PELO|nr:hypothetical protein B9Z55_011463 [Caenorhabditis nigoni]
MTIRHSILLVFLLTLIFKFSRQFSEETVKFSIAEDAPIDTIIGHLTPENGYSYRLSRGNSKIKFNEETLEFSVSSPLDRESENAIDMLIVSSPPSIIHVLIDILDINDNPPKFPLETQNVEIPETAPIGWRVPISGATDPDQGKNGSIGKYELDEITVDGDTRTPPFRLLESDGFVYLEVVGILDREARDFYSMRLTATDEGVPELSASCLLTIRILDINDNPPDFGIRQINLKWNGQKNAKLFRLNATDADFGDNGKLNYRIQGGEEMFGILEEGNERFLVTKNSTKCSPICEFVIEAKDSGIPPLATTLNVVVQMEYGNEHEPNINIRFYPSDFPFIVVQPEDVNGKTLAILSLTDPDGPLGPSSKIWIDSGNDQSIFSLISRQSINILTLKNVDLAEKEEYTLEFAANDGQGPEEKICRRSLKIFFKKFVKSTVIQVAKEIHVELERDTVAGSFVAHVEANCSEMCRFELQQASDVFRIDGMNGIIVTSSELPSDVSSYHLPIRIHPPPPSTQILETDVFVKILQTTSIPKNLIRSPDPPVHLKRAYTFDTWQNVTVGTVVGKLPKAQIYSTKDLESELGVFPDGSIFVGKSISGDLVRLEVVLENRNTTQTSLVTVILKPLNRHSPICADTKIRVLESENPGNFVGKLHAMDADSGINGVVTYRVLEDSKIFHVDTMSGKLRILKNLDTETQRNYTIFYEARDSGSPQRITNCSAQIFVEDVNDNAPKFTSSFYSAKISGKSNETVAIVHADDEDVTPENRRIQYRLLNHQDAFHVDSESGKVTTIQNLPKSFGSRINVSIEAVNVDSDNFLSSKTFLLITVVNSTKLDVHLNSDDVVRIHKNDRIGSKIGKLDVTSSDSVFWRTDDSRIHLDSSGNFILIQNLKRNSMKNFNVILTSQNSANSEISEKILNFKIEFMNSDRNSEVPEILEIPMNPTSSEVLNLESENWKIAKIILENPEENSEDVKNIFVLENQILRKSENRTTSDAYVILETNDERSNPQFKILHVTSQSSSTSPTPTSSECTSSSAHLITPPATVPLPRGCQNVSLQNPKTLQIHKDTLLIPTQSEIISHVDLVSTSSKKPFMMTLIKDEQSEDVRFATSSVLMLLSSVHQIGASFGRVTAESGYRIRYFLIGTDTISIDADTGELFLKKRFYKNLNDILIVAVIPKGIAKTKVTIEVVEDHLTLPKTNFLLLVPSESLKSENSLGAIRIPRDDVIIDVIDDFFYVRDSEIYAKKHFTPSNPLYELSGIVKKGKLSTKINVTLFFGNSENSKKENELIFEVEENSKVGTVVGIVPNAPHSKYRLIDANCGLEIDKNGIIRTTKTFDRESQNLLKTKMIEPAENRIFDLLIFIKDVNDNPPEILNAPAKIIVSKDLEYQLIFEDPDAFSDFNFHVVDGDSLGHLEISDSGVLRLQNLPSESFNATIRIQDQRPPFQVNSDDVTIEFLVDSDDVGFQCEDAEFYVTSDVVGVMKASQKATWRILNPRGAFKIDPISGDIQKTSNFLTNGIQKNDVVELKIQAISYDAEDSGFCTARIFILEDSEDPKILKFENFTFHFSVLESSDRFLEVGRISLDSEDSTSDNVEFRILNDDFNFTISPFDGVLYTNSPLDFETIKSYNLTIEASTSSGTSSECHVIIDVIDENDEVPRFITGDLVNLWVREEQKEVSYPLVIGSSIAEDLDENSVVTYSILSGNTSLFALNSTTGDILSLTPLDREESALHEILIEAKDSGFPSLSATSRILIHVEDVNDNAPEFDQPSYYVNIKEDAQIGVKILRIQATDADLNSVLQYSWDSEGDVVPFRIDVATGWITVAGKLEEGIFEYRILVSDGERFSRASLEIEVEDVNDHSPVILNSNLDVYVPESSSSEDVIHVIDVSDLDSNDHLKFSLNNTNFKISDLGEIIQTPESQYPSSIRVTVVDDVGHVANSEYRFFKKSKNGFPVFTEKMEMVTVREHETQELAVFRAKSAGVVRYSIVSKCKEHLEIEPVSGILKTRASLDREKFSECPVFVIATSFVDNKPLQAITKTLIKILDINDNSPRFSQQVYKFNVTENSGPTFIGHVIARDADSGSRIFYEIVSGDPNHEFVISDNGQIDSIRDLDRESKSEYRLILEAFDDGKPRRRGNTTVLIRVLDEDDNAPRFSRIFHVEIPEDVAVGKEIIQLTASDSDEISNHKFEFEGSGEVVPFQVEQETGRVFVNDTLDFEKKSSYRIKVRLTDGAWLIETSLFINIKDVNDNFPIFKKPEYIFVSSKNSSEIGVLHASDLDSGANGKITYSLTSPFFRIHPDSGSLTKLRPLPDDVTVLEVVAMDHGAPRLQNSVKVYVAEDVRIQKLRNSAKSGDVIGEGFSSGALLVPRGIATVTREGILKLKKSPEDLWILENTTMTSYVVVEDSEIQNPEILNLTSSESRINFSECVNPGIPGFHISKTGFFHSNDSRSVHVTCHDDLWPRRLQNLTLNIRKAPESPETPEAETMIFKKSKFSKNSNLPESLDLKISSESPPGTVLWTTKNSISMENNKFFNLSNGNLILKTLLDSEATQLEIFDTDHKRTTITIHPQHDIPACPVFPHEFYFFENPKDLEIFNFKFPDNSEVLKTCRMEIEDQRKVPLFHVNGSRILSLRRLQPGTYQFSLVLKSSRCHVTITVTPERPPAHQTLPTVVFASSQNPLFHLPRGFDLKSSIFTVSTDSGEVRSRGILEKDRIYQLGAIRIFTEDSEDSESTNLTSSEDSEASGSFKNLEKEAVQFSIFSRKSGISKLLHNLRDAYSDMKIHLLATWQHSEDVKYDIILGVVDRNEVVVTASEVQKTLTSFFKKHRQTYLDFLGFSSEDICSDVICIQKNATCQRTLEKRTLDSRRILEVPEGNLVGKCFCENGECEEEAPEVLKDDVDSENCDDVDCGASGSCNMDNGRPICRCKTGNFGFESFYSCEKFDDVFSTSSGGILEIAMKNSSSDFDFCESCDGKIQKIEMDFRTSREGNSEILRVEFGKQTSIIELHSGSIQFSISDEFTRPIETKIEKPRGVNDGRWHRLQLQMSDDGRRISIQIDGRGKEVKSRIPLPMLFTSRRIQIKMSPGFCFRRLLAQNQWIHPQYPKNQYFEVSTSSKISATCQFESSRSSGLFTNTTTWILLSMLCFISLIALSLCILAIRRRWNQKTTSEESHGWKKATEIDAFAVPRRVGGHINRSMVRSPDDDTYDVAEGYGTQMVNGNGKS